jgi:putative ABC transport system ATP-binding protein
MDERSGAMLLHPLAFTLAAGDRVAITGPSGSGKSVLLRTLALLDAPHGGEIHWQGAPIATAQIPGYRGQVCYIAQKPAVLDGSVEDNLRYPYSLKVHAQARFEHENVVQLLAKAGKPAAFLDKQASELSGGEAQVMALVRALQLNPRVLLLDEPTAALDPASARQVEDLVDAWFDPGRALIWVSHDPAQAERVSDRQRVMTAGSLA